MGIYHRDLRFRNTIKIGEIFKIIDFDYAFVVKKLPNNSLNGQSYESTQKIIEFWLSFDYSKESRLIEQES